ncbi:MAG: molybdopterin molybdotransferase MoeA [Arcobacter sp.]|nr:molybdopterin molybdotransferase MoeA [Arcobacter sp.]
MAVDFDKALDIIYNNITNKNFEVLPIENALARICYEGIYAKYSLPSFDNSAMDGYAILYEDKNEELEVIDTIFAGDNNDKILKKNTCIKIMTGARLPSNANTIVPKEDVQIKENKIILQKPCKKFQHIKYIGEDIKKDEVLIKKGEELNFSKISLLASQGISHIKIYKKPKVVIFSSGEELKQHFEQIQEHQIYNSNTPTLMARAKELGCEVSFIGQARDNIDSIKELISNCLDADLIITTGGMSVGDADFTKDAFRELNIEVLFDGIKIKPGKPTLFGKIGNTFILNLPGNPLAGALIFEIFGKAIVQKLLSAKEFYPNFIQTKIKKYYKNKKGRITVIPGYFDGEFFEVSPKFSPSMVSPLSKCNALIVLDEKIEELKENQDIKILPINWKFFSENKKDFINYE